MEARALASSIHLRRRYASMKVTRSLLAVLLIGTACSSSNVTRSPAAESDTDDRPRTRADGQPGSRNGENRSPSPARTSRLPGERVDPSSRIADPRGPLIAQSRAQDPAGDTHSQGDAPAYLDLRSASIEGYQEEALLRATFSTALPKRMPARDTFMRIGFRLQGEDRDIAIGVSSDHRGWSASINAGDDFPGSLQIRGSVLIILLPWEDIGGRGGFLWQATSNWSRASEGGTEFGFDSVPDERLQRYRE